MNETKETPKLSPALNGKFEAVGVAPGVIVTKKYGDVDLRTLSLEKAELLVKNGFRYLRKIEKPAKELPEKK
jgi:hypothetical protein